MSQKDSALSKFFASAPGRLGVIGLALLLLPAIFAPFLANGRPLLVIAGGKVSLPFLNHFFAPNSADYDVFVEVCFNYLALCVPFGLILLAAGRCHRGVRMWRPAVLVVLLLILPFTGINRWSKARVDRRDYRAEPKVPGEVRIFAPLPYSPFEQIGRPYEAPSLRHPMGCDSVGRDVAVRLIYGARTSLAVGIFATAVAVVIGTMIGIAAGYWRGWFDLVVMRIVEILMCFPTFLLLLILMSSLGNRAKPLPSIPVVISVLGLTGWIGAAFLVRGETLKQCAMPYIQSCEVSGVSIRRIMFRHLLPNISPVLLTWGVFAVAGAIMAENGLSFLGFGVKEPGASWGGLLSQAFYGDPVRYWHLTVFPGAAIFLAVISFNFLGDGIGKALSPK